MRATRTRLAPILLASSIVGALGVVGCTATTTTSSGPAGGQPSATSGTGSGATSPERSTTTRRNAGSTATTDRTTGTDDTDTTESTDTTDAGALPAACDLITQRDAEAAIGEPVTAGTHSTSECWWSTANDLKTVNVIRREGDIEQWRSGLQSSSSWEPIALGDEGYRGTVLDSITFRKGEVTYEINVVYSSKGDPGAVVRELAALVASRV